jgi:hypothetical protein
MNGTAVNGATSQNYTAAGNGVFATRVTLNGCTSGWSNPITVFTIPGIVTGPNPVTGKLIIQLPNNTETLSVLLMDINGQSVLEKGTFTTYFEIDMSRYMPGNYVLQIVNERTGAREQRIIVKM